MESELEARVEKKLLNNLFFAGAIILVTSTKVVPTGWLLCNGAVGTPDLSADAPTGTKYIMRSAS